MRQFDVRNLPFRLKRVCHFFRKTCKKVSLDIAAWIFYHKRSAFARITVTHSLPQVISTNSYEVT